MKAGLPFEVKPYEGGAWDPMRQCQGLVRAHRGCYHDAIHVKRNEFWLAIAEIFGGLNRAARCRGPSSSSIKRGLATGWTAPSM